MSSNVGVTSVFGAPVAALQYRETSNGTGGRAAEERGKRQGENQISEGELAARILKERAEAAQQAEAKVRQEYERKLEAARADIARTVSEFAAQRDNYFGRVEEEVVQLALSIAARIMHREAQVDPLLMASLVRISMERLREGSSVTVRVSEGRGQSWKDYFAAQPAAGHVEVVEDAELKSGDCILETELGSTNLSLEAQLKEVERGFFDLLALRPAAQ